MVPTVVDGWNMRARRTDENLTDIVKAARAMGFKVHVTNADWDLTVQHPWGWIELWEVKTRTGRYTKLQERMKDEGWMVRTVRTKEDVVEARNSPRSAF